jgi:hypothetical protein
MTEVWRIGFGSKGSSTGPATTLLWRQRTTGKESAAKKAGFKERRVMERSTHICKNCSVKTTYWTEKPEEIDIVPTINCPVCGVVVSELIGAKMIAFFKSKTLE